MKIFRYLIVNVLFLTALVLGIFFDVEGAENIARFWVFVLFFISISFCLKEEVGLEVASKSPCIKNKFLDRVDLLFDLFCLGIIIYDGWYILGSLYFLHVAIMAAFRDDVRQKEQEEQKEN